ncbi:Hypothetical predicted protein [Octopus vulgaris]|uniref:Uncharacterized protein n=1 Tax=Octopus vulgaris TaxID=6645 RepID=A0AA36ASG0_OCTVU|nr:Hypothetical predicted protein [Octopus vulgaris]
MDAPQNYECPPVTMRKIRDVIHQLYPYAEFYKNRHAVEQQEEERARRDKVPIRRSIGLPESIRVPQLDHHEDLDHPGIATLTDEQRLMTNAVLESVEWTLQWYNTEGGAYTSTFSRGFVD